MCPVQIYEFGLDEKVVVRNFRTTTIEEDIKKLKKNEQTDIFKERYRWRAGVEATMSELDRRTDIKHLRVRGIKAVRLSAILKAVGLNILRAATAKEAENNSKYAYFMIYFALLKLINTEKVFFKNFQRSKKCC